jgi:hypothetical protein
MQTTFVTGISAVQAAADWGGVFEKIADGEYQHTFRTRAPAAIDRSATHTIGIYGSLNLDEFDLGRQFADAVLDFVPYGSTVVTVRDVVRTESCNACHDQLSAHRGSRRSVALCVMCHTPQTIDPDTGNTMDMPVLAHKIHMGASLPSVQAGGKYVVIGNQQSVHATGQGHVNPQISDGQCGACHVARGELELDASIQGAHSIPRMSPSLPGVVFELVRVDDGTAGKRPTVTFTIKDKSGKSVRPWEMTRLALVLAGPATDYASYVSEDVRQAHGIGGTYFWTFQKPLPETAKGTYSIGIEGYRNATLLKGTTRDTAVRDAGINRVIHFSVDGSQVQPAGQWLRSRSTIRAM